MPALEPPPTDRMRCMELWGGNSHVHRGLTTPGLQVWVYSQPYADANRGGDVYYISSCASGRITRLLLADVSGHGHAVAAISANLRDLMRRNVNFINQRQFVREMNQQFAEHTALDEFATALVCTFFSPTRRLEFCNAGHPSPLLYQAKNNSWVLATAAANAVLASGIADTPLGAIDDAEYSRFEIQLEPGDMVLCVSDAFSDACDDRGERLGIEGLLAVVRELDVSQPDTLIETLTGRIQRDLHKHRFEDDATAVLFRSDGSSPSLSSDLIAPVRMLRGVRDATDLERVDETPHPVPPRRGTGATDGQAP